MWCRPIFRQFAVVTLFGGVLWQGFRSRDFWRAFWNRILPQNLETAMIHAGEAAGLYINSGGTRVIVWIYANLVVDYRIKCCFWHSYLCPLATLLTILDAIGTRWFVILLCRSKWFLAVVGYFSRYASNHVSGIWGYFRHRALCVECFHSVLIS